MDALTQIQAILLTMLNGRWVKHEAFGATKQGKPASLPCFAASAQAGDLGYIVKRDGSTGFMRLDSVAFGKVVHNGETLRAWVVTHLDPRTLQPISNGKSSGTQVSDE